MKKRSKFEKDLITANQKVYIDAFKDLDYILDDLLYYLAPNFYELIGWIRSHRKDLKKYIKQSCLEYPCKFEHPLHNAHAVLRSRISRALCTRGTDEFYCKAPTDDGSGEHEAGHAVSDWVHARNMNHENKVEYESMRTWKKAA